MRHTFLRYGFLSFVTAALVACGGSTDTGGDNGGDDTGVSGTDTAIGDGTGSDTSSNDSSGGDSSSSETSSETSGDSTADGDAPPVCSSEPTRTACQDCCAAEHKTGRDVFDAALIACACTDGICKSECATTACATPATAPDTACKACLAASVSTAPDAGADAAGPDGKCRDSVTSACSSDSKCVAYLACLGTCPGG